MSSPRSRDAAPSEQPIIQTFQGESGRTYIVFRSFGIYGVNYHAFIEVDTAAAARDCGARGDGTATQLWSSIWRR